MVYPYIKHSLNYSNGLEKQFQILTTNVNQIKVFLITAVFQCIFFLGLLSHDPSRHASPEFRSRGLLPTPGPPLDPTRFLGMRGRFPLPGGPRMRHPLPGQRMAGPMGRGGMPNRFPIRNPNQVSSWLRSFIGAT